MARVGCYGDDVLCSCDALALIIQGLEPGTPRDQIRCLSTNIGGLLPFTTAYTIVMPATFLIQTVHTRQGAVSVTDDVEITTTHWRWDGVGDPGPTDFDTVADRLDDFWTPIAGLRHASIDVREHRFYPAVLPPANPGPALYVKTAVVPPGSGGTTLLPPQVASTLTQITDVRRRWGRFYIGGLTTSQTDTAGRLTLGAIGLIVESGALAFANTSPVWRLQVFGAPLPNSLPVRSVRCDDVLDIIRSRRYDTTLIRETTTLD